MVVPTRQFYGDAMKIITLAITIFSPLLLINIGFAAEMLVCPLEIQTSQQPLEKIEGWEYGKRIIKHEFEEVVFFDGHPTNKHALKYDEEHEGLKGHTLIWNFSEKAQYWVRCGYDGTTVALIKQLPEGTRSCGVTYVRSEMPKIACK